MTPEEAQQKIIDKVLATKEGWIASHVDVFPNYTKRFYAHPDIPDVIIKVACYLDKPTLEYEFSICVEKYILALDKSPKGAIAAIVENAEANRVKNELSERDNKLIAIAQSL